MIQIVHLPPVRNVHRVDGVAVVSLTAHVDVYLISVVVGTVLPTTDHLNFIIRCTLTQL